MGKDQAYSSGTAAQASSETGRSTTSTRKVSVGSRSRKGKGKARDSGVSGQFDTSNQHELRPKTSGPRLARFLPVRVAPANQETAGLGADISASKSETMDLPKQQSSNKQATRSKTLSTLASYHVSLYSGPQVAEACVDGALLHVLQPCGHRIMTREPQPCGENCKGSHALFANSKKSSEKFACAVCISIYVREHYNAKKNLFLPSLDSLDWAFGGIKPGWKQERLARMERVWKNDALEEQLALETLGRYCEAINTSPDDEALVTVDRATPSRESPPPKAAATSIPSTFPKSKAGRLPAPAPKNAPKRSHLPTPSPMTPSKKTVEDEGVKERRSRLPVGPGRPRQ